MAKNKTKEAKGKKEETSDTVKLFPEYMAAGLQWGERRGRCTAQQTFFAPFSSLRYKCPVIVGAEFSALET